MFVRILLVMALVFSSHAAFASDIVSKVFPLERNGVKLYLERMQATDGEPHEYQSDVLSEEDVMSDEGVISDAGVTSETGVMSDAGYKPDTNSPVMHDGVSKQILLAHGLTYSSHEFDVNVGDYSLARFLVDNGYSVWLLDIAGYGRSEKVEDGFSVNSDTAAEDIAAAAKLILETSGQEKLDILGWSWGTVTGGRFAAKYPEMVRKLVLYAPILTGLAEVNVDDHYIIPTWAHAASDFQTKADKTIDYDIVEQLVADTFLSNCWRYDGAGSPNGGRRDLLVSPENRLIPTSQIKAPTLMIMGDKDEYLNVVYCRGTLSSLPEGSQIKVIPGAAHAMLLEAPYYVEFRDAVINFLQNEE